MTASPKTRPVLTVVSNADEKFFPGLAVALASAAAAASGKFDYHFLVLDGGLATDSLAELGRTIDAIASHRGIRAKLDSLVIDQNRLHALPEQRGSRMTYAKLVLPEVLPHLDSIIYLDADVLCFTGLETVHPPAGESKWLLAGSLDFFDRIEKDCPWTDQLDAEERKLPYINCGVMWMNLQGLREIGFTNRAIEAGGHTGPARDADPRACNFQCRKKRQNAPNPPLRHDQTIFNFLCRGKSFILPDSINHRTSIGSARLLCEGNLDLNLHYIGSPKPWVGPPKTSNWLAHQLWHQAATAIFPEMETEPQPGPPHDMAIVRRKSWLYAVTNPKRAAHYGWDLLSLKDPAGALGLAKGHWDRHLAP